jgi:hypothetical protein
MLDVTAFGYDRYTDGPLVFANACGTSAATAHYSPILEDRLFQNGCRAYIGTETKVPVTLAVKTLSASGAERVAHAVRRVRWGC